MSSEARERSVVSNDHDVSDAESDNESSKKTGRKKDSSSTAARRDQNRIAQREFRLRKQQRIRDLEARVELLSGNKDEVVTEMKQMLQDLMEENQTLRNIVKSLGTFVSEASGGVLAKIGWTQTEFDRFVSKTATDTAYESHQRIKTNRGNGGGGSAGKRRQDSAGEDHAAKRARNGTEGEVDGTFAGAGAGYPLSMPNTFQRSPAQPVQDTSNLFSQLMRSAGTHMYMPPTSSTQPAHPTGAYPPYNPQTYLPSLNSNPNTLPPLAFGDNNSQLGRLPNSAPARTPVEEDDEIELDPKKEEASKLLGYHMDNFKRNPNYHLPPSLRPTEIQKTIPHNAVLDGVPIPELRDLMILLRDKFDLADALHAFFKNTKVHGDDVLAAANWELDEGWMKSFGFLVNQGILDMTNRWRRERGDRELTLDDIGPDAQRGAARV